MGSFILSCEMISDTGLETYLSLSTSMCFLSSQHMRLLNFLL